MIDFKEEQIFIREATESLPLFLFLQHPHSGVFYFQIWIESVKKSTPYVK